MNLYDYDTSENRTSKYDTLEYHLFGRGVGRDSHYAHNHIIARIMADRNRELPKTARKSRRSLLT